MRYDSPMKSTQAKENNRLYMVDYVANNRAAVNARKRERYQRVKDEEAIKRKVYYGKNREKILPVVRRYAKANGPKIYRRACVRHAFVPEDAAVYHMRSILRVAFKWKNPKENCAAASYLGCSVTEAKNYIASKFESGMSWDNWGLHGWHVDHIRPVSSFDFDDPAWAYEVSHYTNLQPLWAEDNMAKGSKWEEGGVAST